MDIIVMLPFYFLRSAKKKNISPYGITRNKKFEFVYLTKNEFKTSSNTIFYMKRVDPNES